MGALLSLAVGSFGIGMTEFVVMGLLPDIAQDLLPAQWAADPESAIAQTGWLISLYALGVVVGAPTIAAVVAKYPRHRVMLGLAARAHALQRAHLRAADVRTGRGIPLPRRPPARRVLRHRRTRRGRRARAGQAGQGRRLRAHRPDRRQRRGRAARHLPRPAGRLAHRVHDRRRHLRGRDRVHRDLRPRARRRPGAHHPRGAQGLPRRAGLAHPRHRRDRVRRLLRGLQLCRADDHRGRRVRRRGWCRSSWC